MRRPRDGKRATPLDGRDDFSVCSDGRQQVRGFRMTMISPTPPAGVPKAIRFAAAMLLLAAPLPAQQASAAPPTAAGDTTDVVVSRAGLVVSASDIASDVGAAILGRGGNAVDAAVATAFALAVTYPTAGNLGGGGFMVVKPRRGPALAIDYRERAPLRSTRRMYLDSTGSIVRELTNEGYLAAGVPGTVRGLELAHRRYGRLRWRDVVMPAAELAARGFAVSAGLAPHLHEERADRGSRHSP